MEDTRTCKVCKTDKNVALFATYTRQGKKLPLRTCKKCHRAKERERQRKYIAENREVHNRRSRDNKRRLYNEDSEVREKLRERSREYYEANREDVLVKRSLHYHTVEKLRDPEKREELEYRPPQVGRHEPTYEEELEDMLRRVWGR